MNLKHLYDALLNAIRGRRGDRSDPLPPEFWYVGDDLHTRRTVTSGQVAREENVEIKLPDGTPLAMKLPHMLESGFSLRTPLTGMHRVKGHLYVHFLVDDGA